MTTQRRGLGRGLQALIPTAASAEKAAAATATRPDGPRVPAAGGPVLGERGVAAAKLTTPVESDVSRETSESGQRGGLPPAPEGAFFAELPLDQIIPNRDQPRGIFDEVALRELIDSIKEVGLLQPVVVRQLDEEQFELIMGERRMRASKEAGLTTIPAIVRATEDDRLLLDALLENLHRSQLTPLEEAHAYEQLLKDFNCTHEELAKRVGRSRPQVTNTLRLLKLSPSVQKKVDAGVLSAGHARELLSVEDSAEQDKLAERIIREGLSVRSVEEITHLMRSHPGPAKSAPKPRAGSVTSPALSELAGRLSDRFETRVKVDLGQKKGKIVVEFASVDDLQRILSQLAPDEGSLFSTQPRAKDEKNEKDEDES
ncbi:ParB/RepB/Spo0J family partition protein [Streptomyces sp. NPDC047046]|uniref:ParB/RepB/Spo0J family partition protein n=1 Tax=Streptomyces sp. NPDC047046 TaxID=3155378 RepID=UPI0033D7FC7D